MDRNDAIARVARALHDYVLLGDVVTNLAFLRTLCQHPAFCAGETRIWIWPDLVAVGMRGG